MTTDSYLLQPNRASLVSEVHRAHQRFAIVTEQEDANPHAMRLTITALRQAAAELEAHLLSLAGADPCPK